MEEDAAEGWWGVASLFGCGVASIWIGRAVMVELSWLAVLTGCSSSDVVCLYVGGGTMGAVGPRCMLHSRACLAGELIPSWCGVGGLVWMWGTIVSAQLHLRSGGACIFISFSVSLPVGALEVLCVQVCPGSLTVVAWWGPLALSASAGVWCSLGPQISGSAPV
ncbi:hypothetical protein CRENBAI_011515 [Crenichthys baileyi]|uniref:Uncharacterized protein n=1 Tax=Crenichthys baileyi TaxID=28760 RepID=A0AAV9RUP9_9TELE